MRAVLMQAGVAVLNGVVLASEVLVEALLLDPVKHDLDNLLRINRMFEVLDDALDELRTATDRRPLAKSVTRLQRRSRAR